MIIKISHELIQIKNHLDEKVYKIIANDSSDNCDAIICNLKKGGLHSINITSNIKSGSTLIIDCGCKSIEDIESILINRICDEI
jgi:hypothetical protein